MYKTAANLLLKHNFHVLTYSKLARHAVEINFWTLPGHPNRLAPWPFVFMNCTHHCSDQVTRSHQLITNAIFLFCSQGSRTVDTYQVPTDRRTFWPQSRACTTLMEWHQSRAPIHLIQALPVIKNASASATLENRIMSQQLNLISRPAATIPHQLGQRPVPG